MRDGCVLLRRRRAGRGAQLRGRMSCRISWWYLAIFGIYTRFGFDSFWNLSEEGRTGSTGINRNATNERLWSVKKHNQQQTDKQQRQKTTGERKKKRRRLKDKQHEIKEKRDHAHLPKRLTQRGSNSNNDFPNRANHEAKLPYPESPAHHWPLNQGSTNQNPRMVVGCVRLISEQPIRGASYRGSESCSSRGVLLLVSTLWSMEEVWIRGHYALIGFGWIIGSSSEHNSRHTAMRSSDIQYPSS